MNAKTLFTPVVLANQKDVTNKATIRYTPKEFSLERTTSYSVSINATYKNKTTNTLAIVYVCNGGYKCNTSGIGCTK